MGLCHESLLQASVGSALEYRKMMRDPQRSDSLEWFQIIEKRRFIAEMARANGLDPRIKERAEARIPFEMSGPELPKQAYVQRPRLETIVVEPVEISLIIAGNPITEIEILPFAA